MKFDDLVIRINATIQGSANKPSPYANADAFYDRFQKACETFGCTSDINLANNILRSITFNQAQILGVMIGIQDTQLDAFAQRVARTTSKNILVEKRDLVYRQIEAALPSLNATGQVHKKEPERTEKTKKSKKAKGEPAEEKVKAPQKAGKRMVIVHPIPVAAAVEAAAPTTDVAAPAAPAPEETSATLLPPAIAAAIAPVASAEEEAPPSPAVTNKLVEQPPAAIEKATAPAARPAEEVSASPVPIVAEATEMSAPASPAAADETQHNVPVVPPQDETPAAHSTASRFISAIAGPVIAGDIEPSVIAPVETAGPAAKPRPPVQQRPPVAPRPKPVKPERPAPDLQTSGDRAVATYIEELSTSNQAGKAAEYGENFLTQHTEARKGYGRTFLALGKAHLRQHNHAKAEQRFREGFTLVHRSKDVALGLALAHYAQGNASGILPEDARQHYTKSLRRTQDALAWTQAHEPYHITAQTLLMSTLLNMKSYEAAHEQFDRMTDRLPITYLLFGLGLLQSNDPKLWQEAERHLQESVNILSQDKPAPPAIIEAHGQAALAAGKPDIAEKEFAYILEKYPSNEAAIAGIAQADLSQNKIPETKKYLAQLETVDPKNPALPLLQAKTLIKEGKVTEAVQKLVSRINNTPIAPETKHIHVDTMRMLKYVIESGMTPRGIEETYNMMVASGTALGAFSPADGLNLASQPPSLRPTALPEKSERAIDSVIEQSSRPIFMKDMELDIYDLNLRLPQLHGNAPVKPSISRA